MKYQVSIPVCFTIDKVDMIEACAYADLINVVIIDASGAELENEAEEGVFIDEE